MKNVCLAYAALFLHLMASSPLPLPMLILKSPHSGSSWFTSELNKRSGVYIAEEIFLSPRISIERSKKLSPNKHINETALFRGCTEYVAEALRHPMKAYPLGAKTSVGEDLTLVGATINPMSAFYVPLADLPKMIPDLRLVVYVRTNIVKHAIAYIRHKMLMMKCHSHVTNSKCLITGKTTVDVELFDHFLIRVMANDRFNLFNALAVVPSLGRHLFQISYEEVMRDLSNVDRLLQWAGIQDNLSLMPIASGGRCMYNCTKTTSDDLREVVENYEDVESWIRSNYPCLLDQFHETRPDVRQPHVHILCKDLFTGRVSMFIAAEKNVMHVPDEF